MKKITKGKKKGFTLIELIAVIAILAILAAIIIPNVISYIDNANKSAVETNASTAYSAIVAKEADISNNTPAKVPSEGWEAYNTKTTVATFSTANANVLPSNVTTGKNNISNIEIANLPKVSNGGFTLTGGVVAVQK